MAKIWIKVIAKGPFRLRHIQHVICLKESAGLSPYSYMAKCIAKILGVRSHPTQQMTFVGVLHILTITFWF